ncbi:Six-hairpin glycosidase-like protein, partial [Endogone sp. FLAS-F59071]
MYLCVQYAVIISNPAIKYFPPVDAYQTPAFPTVLKYLSDNVWFHRPEHYRWENNQQAILSSGEDIVKFLRDEAKARTAGAHICLYASCLNIEACSYQYTLAILPLPSDAPKFPTSPTLHFFSRYYAANRNPIPPPILDISFAAEVREEELDRRKEKAERSADMLFHTLRVRGTIAFAPNIALGGIHDHLGGGFHRYSVDAAWHVPHDNGVETDKVITHLAFPPMMVHCNVCSNNLYKIIFDKLAQVAKGIILYVERDMTHPEGGFYSAQDADSLLTSDSVHKVEGAYYVWTKKEIEDVLRSPRDVDIFCHHYGVRAEGNVEKRHDPHGELEGKNILTLRHTFDTPTSDLFHLPIHELETLLASHRRVLLSHRSDRPPPHRDDKIVATWNALAVSALARAGLQLQSGVAAKMATRAAGFARTRLWDAQRGRLMRCWYGGGEGDGVSGISGFADDYANMIRACLDLYEVGWDERWVEWAAELQEVMMEGFWDNDAGGFFGEAEEVGMRGDGVGRVARLKD